MTCHMHQPNIFLNSYLGYTMWDYESDAPQMWPKPDNSAPRPPGMSEEEYQKKYKQQRYPTAAEVHKVLERNPGRGDARATGPMSSSCATSMTSTTATRIRSSPTITAMAGTSAASSSATATAIC
jgi:hypothetical protein